MNFLSRLAIQGLWMCHVEFAIFLQVFGKNFFLYVKKPKFLKLQAEIFSDRELESDINSSIHN